VPKIARSIGTFFWGVPESRHPLPHYVGTVAMAVEKLDATVKGPHHSGAI
jgi:hypothetical protein